MKKILFLAEAIILSMAFKPKPAYQIFTGEKAKTIDFDKMMKDAATFGAENPTESDFKYFQNNMEQ